MIADFKKKQKRNISKNFLIIFGGVLILVLIFLLINASIKIHKKSVELISHVESLKNKIQDIKNKNKDLKQNILKSQGDEYIEKVAREELDLQKPGEKVFSFIMPQPKQEENNDKQKNILQIWLGWVVNIWQSFKK